MENIQRMKFNVCLLGESHVGKTCIASVFTGHPFDINAFTTIGLENYLATEKFDGKEYKFKIFDTAGQERYRSIALSTINLSDGFLLVFAVDDRSSFETLEEWIKSIENKCDISKKVLILVGNKVDIEKRQVKNEEAVAFANSKKIDYFETSAKTGFGIQEIFHKIFESIYKKYKEIEQLEKLENEGNNQIEKERPKVKLEKDNVNKNGKTEKKGGFC
jgi:small GTP-binding protein